MRTLVWSNTFIRAFKKTTRSKPECEKEIEAALRLLVEDPFNPALETHKLRIVFEFVKSGRGKNDDIFLMEIGTHDEVY